MPLSANFSDGDTKLVLKVHGDFDVATMREFSEYTKKDLSKITSFVIDLDGLRAINSSALGMLLLLRTRAGGDSADISIIHANDNVKQMMNMANFGQLFKIS